VFDQRGELPLLPFGNPIGFVPASRGGVYIESIGEDNYQPITAKDPRHHNLWLFPLSVVFWLCNDGQSMKARAASQVHDPHNCSVGHLLISLNQDLSLPI